MKIFKMACFALPAMALTLAACTYQQSPGGATSEEIISTGNTDIPSDNNAGPNPNVENDGSTNIPNIQYSVVDEEGTAVIRIDMTGVQGPDSDWLYLLGTNEKDQNIWLEIDGEPKGIKVYNSSDNEGQRVMPVDLVFLVDNSGSMSQEADAVARDLVAWAGNLSRSSLDIRFACVGYDDAFISGACNFCDYNTLSEFFNYGSGTSRTHHFADETLENYATSDYYTSGECGMAALRYATSYFNWRENANRIFVNFTDEPNQPSSSQPLFSVESLKTDWTTLNGTIHTVYSAGQEYGQEYNYLMSQYTGGTYITTNSSFTGVSLDSLPITGALQNSYVIRFTNILKYLDGQPHEVKITIMSPDGTIRVTRTFQVIFVA